MSLKNARKAVSAAIGNVNKDRVPAIKLRDFAVDESGMTRIVAEVTHTSTSRENDAEVYSAISSALHGKMHALENTFYVLSSNKFTDIITGVVAPVQETVAFDSESGAQGFTCVAGNMYIDENEKLWSLKKTEGGDLLIKTNPLGDIDSISELLASCSASMVEPLRFETQGNVMEDFNSLCASISSGDFIDFVNPETRCADFGVVVASVVSEDDKGAETETGKLIVLSSSGEHEVTVDRQLVISQHNDVEVPESDESAYDSVSSVNLEAMVAYYRSMFRRSPEYFAMFEARLRSHAFQ